MESPEEVLYKYWGFKHFRPLQKEIITSVLNGIDTLALLPTGSGKSLCYQIPAALLNGVCLVISPLIALMSDQVIKLDHIGYRAAFIHSGLHFSEIIRILNNAVHGAYKIIYISPERLSSTLFLDYLEEMEISFVAVDEAHCISQWGNDFRPSYKEIHHFKLLFPKIKFLALTATATEVVCKDIVQELHFKNYQIFKASYKRENIKFSVQYSENKIADVMRAVDTGCSIVYCRSRLLTKKLSDQLNNSGRISSFYHAGLSFSEKEGVQRNWMQGIVPIIVATTAFGMGIDKPNVRNVVHFDLPEDLESYYQEAGRAGRDGEQSYATLFYNSSDISRQYENLQLKYPSFTVIANVYQAMMEYFEIPIGNKPENYLEFDLNKFCLLFKWSKNIVYRVIKLLERQGFLFLIEAPFKYSKIKFGEVYHLGMKFQNEDSIYNYVLINLLRQFPDIVNNYIFIDEKKLAYKIRISIEELKKILLDLNKSKVLDYVVTSNNFQVLLNHVRVNSAHLNFNIRLLQELKEIDEQKTDSLIGFITEKAVCRQKFILNYFGELDSDICNKCDICLSKLLLREENLREVIIYVLQSELLSVQDLIIKLNFYNKDFVVKEIRSLIEENIVILNEYKLLTLKD